MNLRKLPWPDIPAITEESPSERKNNLVGGRTAAVLSSQGFLCQNPDPNFFEARVV